MRMADKNCSLLAKEKIVINDLLARLQYNSGKCCFQLVFSRCKPFKFAISGALRVQSYICPIAPLKSLICLFLLSFFITFYKFENHIYMPIRFPLYVKSFLCGKVVDQLCFGDYVLVTHFESFEIPFCDIPQHWSSMIADNVCAIIYIKGIGDFFKLLLKVQYPVSPTIPPIHLFALHQTYPILPLLVLLFTNELPEIKPTIPPAQESCLKIIIS